MVMNRNPNGYSAPSALATIKEGKPSPLLTRTIQTGRQQQKFIAQTHMDTQRNIEALGRKTRTKIREEHGRWLALMANPRLTPEQQAAITSAHDDELAALIENQRTSIKKALWLRERTLARMFARPHQDWYQPTLGDAIKNVGSLGMHELAAHGVHPSPGQQIVIGASLGAYTPVLLHRALQEEAAHALAEWEAFEEDEQLAMLADGQPLYPNGEVIDAEYTASDER